MSFNKIMDLSKDKMVNPGSAIDMFALDVLNGLSSMPKSIPPRYMYDDIGSKLFQKITEVDEYYPTECEFNIFHRYKTDIANLLVEDNLKIVEFGAGDGRKTKVLLEEFLRHKENIEYCPIDISSSSVHELMKNLKLEFPSLATQGIVAEYFQGLQWLRSQFSGRCLVMFLGSNIGNFTIPQARIFLRTMWNFLNQGDYVLIGGDLKKDIEVMLDAYNDPKGLTKAFNLNLLTRINRELGGNFDENKFSHFGTYNVQLGAMESYLLSEEAQEIFIKSLQKTFTFKPYESIHVEYSFKYLPSELQSLVEDMGFKLIGSFFDEKRYFMDAVFRVEKV